MSTISLVYTILLNKHQHRDFKTKICEYENVYDQENGINVFLINFV